MSAGRAFGFGLLGAVLGALAGGLAGLGGGQAWVTWMNTSPFEGYAGFVVVYWILAGIIVGSVTGAVIGARKGRN